MYQSKKTKFKILYDGSVKMAYDLGYCLVGGPDAVCFFIDPQGRASIEASTSSDNDCPVIYVCDDSCDENVRSTEIEFIEYPGWRFHSGGSGKSIAISLVRKGAEE